MSNVQITVNPSVYPSHLVLWSFAMHIVSVQTLTLTLLVPNLANTELCKFAKNKEMTETLARGYSPESTQRVLSNEFQHDKVNLPVKERLLFYNCYILPHLNYCCSVWGNCPANQQNRITKLQKRAACLILDADLSILSSDLFKKLKWLPFPKYVEYQQSVTVYKSLNELNPHYMNKLFSYTQENHSYGTRNATSSLLALPKCNKSIGQKCISYSGPKVWNGLTEAIRCAPSLPSFNSQYLKAMYCITL